MTYSRDLGDIYNIRFLEDDTNVAHIFYKHNLFNFNNGIEPILNPAMFSRNFLLTLSYKLYKSCKLNTYRMDPVETTKDVSFIFLSTILLYIEVLYSGDIL